MLKALCIYSNNGNWDPVVGWLSLPARRASALVYVREHATVILPGNSRAGLAQLFLMISHAKKLPLKVKSVINVKERTQKRLTAY